MLFPVYYMLLITRIDADHFYNTQVQAVCEEIPENFQWRRKRRILRLGSEERKEVSQMEKEFNNKIEGVKSLA